MSLSKRELAALRDLVETINEADDRQDVSSIDGVKREGHGTQVTLTVTQWTRKGPNPMSDEDVHDQWSELLEEDHD